MAWITVYPGMKETGVGKKYLVHGMLSDKSRLALKHCGHMLCKGISLSGVYVLILLMLIDQRLRCTLPLTCAFHMVASCLPKAEISSALLIDQSVLLHVYLQ